MQLSKQMRLLFTALCDLKLTVRPKQRVARLMNLSSESDSSQLILITVNFTASLSQNNNL